MFVVRCCCFYSSVSSSSRCRCCCRCCCRRCCFCCFSCSCSCCCCCCSCSCCCCCCCGGGRRWSWCCRCLTGMGAHYNHPSQMTCLGVNGWPLSRWEKQSKRIQKVGTWWTRSRTSWYGLVNITWMIWLKVQPPFGHGSPYFAPWLWQKFVSFTIAGDRDLLERIHSVGKLRWYITWLQNFATCPITWLLLYLLNYLQ